MSESSSKFRVEPLQGEADYLDWSDVMVNVFKTEGVYRYVAGVVTEPVIPALADDSSNAAAVTAADLLHDKWESSTAKAMLLIQQHMSLVPKTFVQQSTLMKTGTPNQLWKALENKYSLVSYSLQLDIMADFHALQVGAGGITQFVEDLRVIRSKVLAVSIQISEFDLKCKLFAACNDLPDTVRSFVYSNLKGEQHKDLTFEACSVILLSFTKSAVPSSASTSTPALAAGTNCPICDRTHHGVCWGPIGSAAREKNIAAWKKSRKAKPKSDPVVAGIATVPSSYLNANLNSNDPYCVVCCVCNTNTIPDSQRQWVADSGAGRHMARTGTPTKYANHTIGCANGEVLKAKGSLDMGALKDVLVVPGLAYNLASIGCLCDTGGNIHCTGLSDAV
jgi:hypothetical protein